jgi:CRP-like cAMP-binding protein
MADSSVERLPTSPDALEPFLRQATALVRLGDEEIALLRSFSSSIEGFAPGDCIRPDPKMRCWIVASGWAYYMRAAADGRRQIFSLILPGDTIGIVDGPFERDETEVRALTSTRLIDATRLRWAITHDAPCANVRRACELISSLEGVRLLDQVFRLGQLSAEERLAHLLLELNDRLEKIGLAHQGTFDFPPSQAQLGDILGLSLVHINRVMHALREERLMIQTQRRVVTLNLEGLARRAGVGSEAVKSLREAR